MPVQHPSLIRFNGGQWSTKLRARVDLEDYDASLEVMDGFIPLKYGEAQAMTGFLYGAATKDPDLTSILIPFQYSATDSFWIELGQLYLRVVNPSTGTYVESAPGVPFELTTAYTAPELYDIQYQVLNDVIILTHGDHMPQEVTRITDTNWTIADFVQDWPAFLSENLTRTHYIAPSAVTGSVTLTATGSGNTPFDFPTNDMIGTHFALTQIRAGENVIKRIDTSFTAASTETKVKGDWTFKSLFENPLDVKVTTIDLDRSDDGGSTWTELFSVTTFVGYPGFDISGTEKEDDILFRYTCSAFTSVSTGNLELTFTTDHQDISGYAKITAIASTTSATATVVSAFESTIKTNKWREGGWSDKQGYPKACTVFEQRVFFGGTTLKPTGVWASATDDISNFDFRSTEADQAFFRVIDNSQNAIQWMARKDKVMIGTAGEEFFLSSSNEQEAITPANVTVKTSGGNGSAQIKPISLGSSLAFVTLNKIQLRELAYNGSTARENSDTDLTELSDEITGAGINQIAFQQYPHRIIYTVISGGTIAALVFDKQNNVKGWFTRSTDGQIESIVSTRSGAGANDPLGIVVRRVINGVVKRSIEVLAAPSDTNTEWVFMDSAVNVPTLGGTTVTGASHLEGKTVRVMNDGALETNKVVTSGQFELDRASAVNVVYGLDYTSSFTTLPIRVNTGDGNAKGKPKTASHVMLGVRQSLSGQYGYVAIDDNGDQVTSLDNIYSMDTGSLVMGVPQTPVTRYYRLPMDGGHWREYSLKVTRNNPFPLNVTHAIPAMEVSGD